MLGWLGFSSDASNDITGDLNWIKPPVPGAQYFPAGFTFDAKASGSRYTPPRTGVRVLALTFGALVLAGATPTDNVQTLIHLGPDNRVTDISGNNWRINFVLSSGLFCGHGVNPLTGTPFSLAGMVLQKRNCGAGFFTEADRTGGAYLQPH